VVQHLVIYTVEENRRDSSEPVLRIMYSMLGTLAISLSKPCNAPLTVNGDRARMTGTLIHLVWRGSEKGGPSHTRL
jgi:hypothetical protein